MCSTACSLLFIPKSIPHILFTFTQMLSHAKTSIQNQSVSSSHKLFYTLETHQYQFISPDTFHIHTYLSHTPRHPAQTNLSHCHTKLCSTKTQTGYNPYTILLTAYSELLRRVFWLWLSHTDVCSAYDLLVFVWNSYATVIACV